jgi:[acyl-carrier-protein] S-malonyltransferase
MPSLSFSTSHENYSIWIPRAIQVKEDHVKKIAFLFPGQGAQAIGMGQDFYQEFGLVRELFDMAEEITKINLSKLCFEGPLEALTETINLQPAVTAVNLAILSVIEKEGILGALTAGHSLGEYSALCGSGALSREDTFKLVLDRGNLMHREAAKYQGAMHAIIGLTIEEVEALVAEVQPEGIVAVANHNAEKQIAITGSPEPVEKVSTKATALGARAVPLKVSGAWHSELIKGAEAPFNMSLDGASFQNPAVPIILNVTGRMSTDGEEIKDTMRRQLCSTVKWYDTMGCLMAEEIDTFVEIGPGSVLSGLLRKTVPKTYPATTYTVNSLKRFEKFHGEVA